MMRPYLVGIAGGTGSGKTTVAKKIVRGLPEKMSLVLEHDYYYRDRSDIDLEARKKLNYDHPDSLDNDLLVEHLRQLKAGEAADVPIYDYKTHSRLPNRRTVKPAPIIVLEGILVFVDKRVRDQLDMKIFVDTDADIRIMRRVRRDIEERGRDFANIRRQYYATVRPMHIEHVEPSKRWADLIIPEGGSNTVALDTIVNNLLYVLSQMPDQNV